MKIEDDGLRSADTNFLFMITLLDKGHLYAFNYAGSVGPKGEPQRFLEVVSTHIFMHSCPFIPSPIPRHG
jgi:hypothetical protein